MDETTPQQPRKGYSRRDVLRAGAAAQALVWVAPAVTVLRPTAALAASPAPGPGPSEGPNTPPNQPPGPGAGPGGGGRDTSDRPTRSGTRTPPADIAPQAGGLTPSGAVGQLANTGLDAGSLAALGGSAAFVGGASLYAARKREARAAELQGEQGPVDTD